MTNFADGTEGKVLNIDDVIFTNCAIQDSSTDHVWTGWELICLVCYPVLRPGIVVADCIDCEKENIVPEDDPGFICVHCSAENEFVED
jgi:hypothetical protein